jgi:ubiquinone/menaquinone biosynthesis C-methylase UbiE
MTAHKTIEVIDSLDFSKEIHSGHPYFVHMLDIKPGMKVLDVGCLNGRDCQALQKMGAITTGIDREQKAINYCKQFPGTWIVADGTDLPFENDTFDLAIANCVLCENDQEEDMYIRLEMQRVAKKVAICDMEFYG